MAELDFGDVIAFAKDTDEFFEDGGLKIEGSSTKLFLPLVNASLTCSCFRGAFCR